MDGCVSLDQTLQSKLLFIYDIDIDINIYVYFFNIFIDPKYV